MSTMLTRDHAYRMLGWRLREAGIDNATLDARLLVQASCGCNEIDMIREPGKMLSAAEMEILAGFESRRLAGEPVSRILGTREFWGLEFRVTPATLDPRPDSETLIEVALKLLTPVDKPSLLDLGTGSGCLLIALLHELPEAQGLGIDLDMKALEIAQENARNSRVSNRATFRHGSWAEGLVGPFDLIISNPPYIPGPDIENLSREVRGFDPLLALDGGADGLDAYRAIALALPSLLKPRGHAVIELGVGQGDDVSALCVAAGLKVSSITSDLGGIPRALVAQRANA